MKLVSMKIDPKKREEMYAEKSTVAAESGPLYPWGLGIHLDDDSLDALGIDELPKVGKSYALQAKCTVTSVSENKTEEGTRRSVSLQITDLAVDLGGDKSKDAEQALYPEKE